jgi:outer membrane protein OmpA-like peptidoglycan-associated protein
MHRTLLALSLATLSGSVLADEGTFLEGTIGLGAAVGGQRYDGSYGDNTTPYYRGHLEVHATEDFAARVVGGFGNISDGSNRFRTEWFSNIGLEGIYQPQLELLGDWRPYLAAGLATDFGTVKKYGKPTFDLDWNFYLPVELGVEWVFSENFSATAFLENRLHAVEWDRLDGIATGKSYYEKRDDLPRAGLGLTWRFGGDGSPVPTKPKVVAKKSAGPLDSDNDGVPDSMDKCPNTLEGMLVDASGCPVDYDKDGVPDYLDRCPGTPAGIAVDAKGCPLDSDKDGVPNYLDKCAGTPAGIPVDAKGCPFDADGDGVADYLDKCPNTPIGEKVDSIGCQEIRLAKGARTTLHGIVFAPGKADIDPSSAPVLAHLAAAIKAAPKAKVEIAGFTDFGGKAKANLTLTAKRAEAVSKSLIKLGVPARQIIAKGYGSAQPVADNTTGEGRIKNRRIEIHVR